jgi:2-aminoadipate transaminase
MLPPIQLDLASPVPLYKQLTDRIRDLILSGQLANGARVPPTRELAVSLSLNRATVSAAYQALESEGLLKGHVGRGSFVQYSDPPVPAPGRRWDRLILPAPAAPAAAAPRSFSFTTSRPAESLFPLDQFREVTREVTDSGQLASILQLGSPYGYEPLRAWLMNRARREGIARDTDDIVITSGCQQALDLLARVLVAPGDTVAFEDPVYPGLRHVFARGGVREIGVPIGDQGIDPSTLARVLEQARPKVLALTPNFQNPTGVTMPLASREAVVRLARAHNTVLLESDIYSPLRYEGDPLPSLKHLDDAGDVIQLGSFSKIAFPGLRIGWVLAPKPVAAALAAAKQWSDLHSDQLAQSILLRFAESGKLEAHRQHVVAEGANRLRGAIEACARYLPPGSSYTRPQGGMNLWVRLPEPLSAAELLPRTRQHGVAYMPGEYFAVSRPEPGSLRLSFAGLDPAEIRRGIEVIGTIAAAELRRANNQTLAEPVMALV